MMRSSLLIVPLLLLGACTTMQTTSDDLERARQVVNEAENTPAVARHAPLALRDAQQSLRQAEQLARQGADQQAVNHHAYLAERRAHIAQAQARREVLARSTEDMERQRAEAVLQDRERAIAEARQEAEQAQAEAERLRQNAEESQQALKDAQSQLADLQPQQTERGIVLTLGEVLFPFDSADLQAGDRRSLDRLAQFLQAHPEQNILIEGHTDSVGDAAYNAQLSEQRANAVYQALTQRGVDPARIRMVGLGEDFPVADNGTREGRAENRRVEVIIAQGTMPQSRQEQQARQGSEELQPPPRG